jgi:hypothetical protein
MWLIVKTGNGGRSVTDHPVYCLTVDKVKLRGQLNDPRALHFISYRVQIWPTELILQWIIERML